MKRNMYSFFIIISIYFIQSIHTQQIDEIVECQPKNLTTYQYDQMNFDQQERLAQEILNEYDKNLTTLAYITSSAEFDSHLYINDTSRKRVTDKYYEVYRGCLKTIALVGRQFKNLIHHQNSSMQWLLLRTQAIGEAGDNNTAMKYELQRIRTQIREIYHRKFIWNQTKLGIDEVQEVLGKLQSPDELFSLWNATYEVSAPMRDPYSTLITLQNEQAKQNRTSAVTHSHI